MAFNWQTFRTRSLTAFVFVIVMLTGLLWNRWSFFILFSIVHFGAWAEYRNLVGKFYPGYQRISVYHKIAVMLAGWCLMFFFTNGMLHIASFHLEQAGLWLGLAVIFVILVLELVSGG